MIPSLVIAGFLLLVGSWFSMFRRIRRDLPGHEMARYSSHLYIPFINRRGGWPLIGFYYRRYGIDARLLMAAAGAALILVGMIASL